MKFNIIKWGKVLGTVNADMVTIRLILDAAKLGYRLEVQIEAS